MNDFIKVCRKHIFIVCLIPIIVVAIVFVINKFILPPKYETNTQLVISMPKNNPESYYLDNLRSSIQLVDTFSSIAQSEKVMQEVVSQLHLKSNSNKVKVITNERSLIFSINVIGTNEKQVMDVANAIANNTKGKFQGLFEGMNVNVLSKATKSNKISIVFQIILGIIAGIMSSVIFIFSILFFSNIITKEEQVNQLGCTILGDIPLVNSKEVDHVENGK